MKNQQKGSVVTWLVIIIVVLIVVGGYYFYKAQNNTPAAYTQQAVQQSPASNAIVQNGAQTTFSHPSGLYSFTYPSDWQFPQANVFSKITSTYYPLDVFLNGKNSDGFSIEVTADQTLATNFEKAAHTGSSKNFTKTNVTVGNVAGYRLEYQDTVFGKNVDEVMYVLPLTYNGSSFVLNEKIAAWDSTWLSTADPVAKSIAIDLTKVPQVKQQVK